MWLPNKSSNIFEIFSFISNSQSPHLMSCHHSAGPHGANSYSCLIPALCRINEFLWCFLYLTWKFSQRFCTIVLWLAQMDPKGGCSVGISFCFSLLRHTVEGNSESSPFGRNMMVQVQESWDEMMERQVWAGHEQTSTRQTDQILNSDQPLLQSTGSQTSVCITVTQGISWKCEYYPTPTNSDAVCLPWDKASRLMAIPGGSGTANPKKLYLETMPWEVFSGALTLLDLLCIVL